MRKKTVGIIGGAVLIAALGVSVFFLLQTQPAQESSDNSSSTALDSEEESIVLTQQDANDVISIDIANSTGSFQVVRTAEAKEDENATFAIAGWEDLSMDSTIWTLANNTASMNADGIVEEDCADLEKFGLDDANAVQVEMHFADGSSYAFRIGDVASNAEETYFATADSDTVYTVKTSYLSNFKKSDVDFVSKTILKAPESEDAYPIVQKFTLDRKDMDYQIELDYDETSQNEDTMAGTASSHLMVSPVSAYLNVDRSTPVITGMFGLTAEKVVTPHPSDADLQQTGLDDPYGVATMVCDDGNTYVLRFGEKFKEASQDSSTETVYYYVYLEGVDVIYQVSEENLVWATTTPTDLASKLMFGTYVWDVGELDVVVDDVELRFNVSGSDSDDAVVTKNGETTESERYRQFYSFLLNTTAETVELNGNTTGKLLAEIHLVTQNGSLEQDFKFYEMDNFTCLITKDGQSAYTCRKSYIDTLLHNMEIYDTDEEFTTNWS